MKLSFVHIVQCADSTYYTGVTSNLEPRIVEHQIEKYSESYTYNRRPVNLVFYCEFTDIKMAIEKEKQIKKWSIAKKVALIKGDYDALPYLAKKKFQ
jgi:putative endonuclease